MENCCVKEIRRDKSPKYIDKSNTLVFAQKCNTKFDGINIRLALFLDEKTLNKYSSGTGTLGRVGLYQNNDNSEDIPIVPDSHVTVIRAYKNIISEYLYAFLKANQRQLEEIGEGPTNQKELKPIILKKLLVPLPPLTEQEQISKYIHNAFTIIFVIEKDLN